LYSGIELSSDTEVLFDVESASGHGLSDALGLAGFTNLDVVRNPNLGGTPYIARLMFHAVVPLSEERVESERTPLSLFTRLPSHRLEFRIGKMSMVDFFECQSSRQRQPSAVHELDRRRQRRLRLCRRHPRI
jgi:high affinity Mn2+ porin